MKKINLITVMTLLFHQGIEGKPLWIPVDDSNANKCIEITTIESNENRYRAKIEIHGYSDNVIDIGGTTYHQLSFDEPGSLSFVGEPALPIISRMIALPKGENLDVKIRDEKWSEEFYVGQVMPSQRSVLETEKEPPFEKDTTVYEREKYDTEMFYIGKLQRWRGINNRALNICPVRYKPRERKISVLKEFVLDIAFEGEVKSNPKNSEDMRLFLNQINITERNVTVQPRDSSENYDYLIITGDIPGVLECQALADFRRWKAFKGLKTKVVSTNMIGETDTQIKQYISCEYNKGIRYVLFIGDCDKIPLHYYPRDTTYTYSDYWYGCMDGSLDVQADISMGRFATNSLLELANMVNKTISYEGNFRNYGREVLLVAHQDSFPVNYTECSESIRTYNNYSDLVSFTTAYGSANGTNADVIRDINIGKNIINYRGHGLHDRWYGWDCIGGSFKASYVDSLCAATNDIYFCIACDNGQIFEEPCFMKAFMCSEHGAAGMIAATLWSYNVENNLFNQNLFVKLFNEHIYNIGELNIAAHISTMYATVGNGHGKAILNAFCYLCGCDPSLEIVTGNMDTFDDYTLSLASQNVIVNSGSISGYKVSMVNEDGTVLSLLNSVGSVCTFPAPMENFYLVLNKHNYVPRVIFVNVTESNIQNKTFYNTGIDNYYIKDSAIHVGYDVTTAIPYGNVTVLNGSKLTISKQKGVTIKNGFKCELGGELNIR